MLVKFLLLALLPVVSAQCSGSWSTTLTAPVKFLNCNCPNCADMPLDDGQQWFVSPNMLSYGHSGLDMKMSGGGQNVPCDGDWAPGVVNGSQLIGPLTTYGKYSVTFKGPVLADGSPSPNAFFSPLLLTNPASTATLYFAIMGQQQVFCGSYMGRGGILKNIPFTPEVNIFTTAVEWDISWSKTGATWSVAGKKVCSWTGTLFGVPSMTTSFVLRPMANYTGEDTTAHIDKASYTCA